MSKRYVGMRVDDELLGRIQEYARGRGLGVSEAIRQLVSAGLGLEAAKQVKMIESLKNSVGEIFRLKAVGNTLSLEKVERKVVDLGRAKRPAGKKEIVNV